MPDTDFTLTNIFGLNDNDSSEDPSIENNRTICRLLKIHFPTFYDHIYIPFPFFRKGNWDISYIVDSNMDSIFYNEEYMSEENKNKFKKIFTKYSSIVGEIMDPNGKLINFLKGWTDMSNLTWRRKNKNSYLKSIITDAKYELISPAHITEIYCEYNNKYKNDGELFKKKLTEYLEKIRKKIKSAKKIFIKEYEDSINDYVYKHPSDDRDGTFSKQFINNLIAKIGDFSEKMIKINVYGIHTMVDDIISFHIPLAEINDYNPEHYHYKKIIVV